jgi:uncharacterized protein DUF3489
MVVKECLGCGNVTAHQHLHDCVHDIPDTHIEKKNDAGSKQARVIEMLQSPTGMTIAAMMKETGWQQHSVRGFLAGVVRKKLKLKLNSKKIDGSRVYRVDGADSAKSSGRQSKRRPA